MQYEKESHAVPSLELETLPRRSSLRPRTGNSRLRCGKSARKDAAGGAVIVAPVGSGRGERGGKVLDNGYATYKINIPKDGNYRLNARVFWKNGD